MNLKGVFWTLDKGSVIRIWYPDGDLLCEIEENLGLLASRNVYPEDVAEYICRAINQTGDIDVSDRRNQLIENRSKGV